MREEGGQLCQNHSVSLLKGIYFKREEFAPHGSKFFSFKVDPFLEEPFCARKHTGSHNVPCISRPLEELWCFRVTSREYFSVGLDQSG